jgi:hypothetical protein
VIKVVDNDFEYSKTSFATVCYQFEEFITSVPTPEREIDFNLYPNPSNEGKIYLSIDNFKSDIKQFTIYNALGQRIKSDKISSSLTEIDVSNLQLGVYILKIGKGKNTMSKTFVVP